MKTLLQIHSSARIDRSQTRHLSHQFITRWQSLRPGDKILIREIGTTPPPPIDQAWIASAFTPETELSSKMRAALRLSDTLIDELSQADVIVLGAPMYNFGVPAQLKAWIDQIVRIGKTFAFDPTDPHQPYRPLLKLKKMLIITATGDSGYQPGGRFANWNHLDPHLRTVFNFIGITDIDFVTVGYDEFADDRTQNSRTAAERTVVELAEKLAGE